MNEPKVGESGLSDEQLLRSIYDFSVHKPDLRKTDPLWHVRDGSGCILGSGYTEKLAIKDAADRIRLSPTPEAKPEPLPNTFQEEPLPCPFCGRAPRVGEHSSTDETGESYGYNYIECEHSGSFSVIVHADSPEDCLRSWNTRLAAPKVVDSKEEHEHKFVCPDQQQCDTECRRNHQCKICNKTRAEVEEQDGEQDDPLRHPFSLRDTAIIEVSQLGIGDVEDVTSACDYPDNSDEAGCTSVCVGVMERALKAEAENKLLKAESVAPPSLPKQENQELPPQIEQYITRRVGSYHCNICGYAIANGSPLPHGKIADGVPCPVAELEEAWNASRAAAPVALPTHQLVERTIQDGRIACLQCSCGRYFIGLSGEALARASFEAHLPEKEGK